MAVFNFEDVSLSEHVAWTEIGVDGSRMRGLDLWTGKPIAVATDMAISLAPHASAILRLAR